MNVLNTAEQLKMVKMVNFRLCIFFTTIKKKKMEETVDKPGCDINVS